MVALSSAEAELYASTRTGAEALGMKSLFSDFGEAREIEMYIDSSSAMALNLRSGLGRAKHIATQDLWMQDTVKQKLVQLKKIIGSHNPADLYTKPLNAETIDRHMSALDFFFI